MLRTLFFMLILALDTLWAATSVIIFGIFNPYSRINSAIMRLWARILVWAAGINVQVEGLENIRPDTSYIITANHQSHIDIPVLVASLPISIRIISKKELFKIPVFGWGMVAAGILKIDRSNRKQAFNTLKRAEELIRKHRLSILAFPEGTRSRDGRVHPFKKGPFVLAINTKVPVLPVSIIGTFRVLPKGTIRLRPGRIQVLIHPPIPTDGMQYRDRNKLMEQTYQIVKQGFEEAHA